MWRQYMTRGDWNTTLSITFKMCGLFVKVSRQFEFIFLIWVPFICLTVLSLPVEERLQALEAANAEIKEILTAKDVRLKALEFEIQNLKSLYAPNTENEFENDDIISLNNQPPVNVKLFRTCHETQMVDPSLKSGLHWIDPDGQGVGDGPIQVHCDMATGVTSILHDSEWPTNVSHCIDPGCYSKSIQYSATIRQMIALVELSDECHQKIKYDCNFAPFEMKGVAYSWWNDRNGNPQYFWSGSNSTVHTCQCGIDNNCLESSMRCNCDSNLPIPQFDSGLITDRNLLPVSRLNFGRIWLNISYGVYTLGRLECSGQMAVNGMASSCADLWKIGHTLSGLYSVVGTKMIESVYCNFTQLPSEAGFEKRMGFLDVKSSPTIFYVQRSTPFNQSEIPIPFEVERVNVGGAMNLTSGIFTAPRPGLYFFTFSGLFYCTSTAHSYLGIRLVWNYNDIGSSAFESEDSRSDDDAMISLQSTLELKAGDTVWLRIYAIKNAQLFDNSNRFTHFTGQLLQEDISQSFL